MVNYLNWFAERGGFEAEGEAFWAPSFEISTGFSGVSNISHGESDLSTQDRAALDLPNLLANPLDDDLASDTLATPKISRLGQMANLQLEESLEDLLTQLVDDIADAWSAHRP